MTHPDTNSGTRPSSSVAVACGGWAMIHTFDEPVDPAQATKAYRKPTLPPEEPKHIRDEV